MLTQECSSAVMEGYSPVAIHNVAVATDFSEPSERALQHGLAVANQFGATLHLLHLVRPSEFTFAVEAMSPIEDAYSRDCEDLAIDLEKNHHLNGIECRRWVERGEVTEVVRNFVEKQHIDLLVVGTHGRTGLERLVKGSVAHQIFHCVRCPVLTVGPLSPGTTAPIQLKRMLFATDLSRESMASVPYLLTILKGWQVELDVLHVCSAAQFGHAELLDTFRDRIRRLVSGNEPSSVRCQMAIGDPARRILECAADNRSDLIVLGLKPHRALYGSPFWSHASEIVRSAKCPVLSVRSNGCSH